MNITLLVISVIIILFLVLLMTSINYEFYSRTKVEINAPAEFTFQRTLDIDVMKKWFSSPQLEFIGQENISGYKNEIGSKWKLIFSSKKGVRMEMLETITDFAENEKISFDLTDPFFKFHVKMLFKENNGKTVIHEELRGKSGNHFFNAMMRVFGGKSRRVKKEQYAILKEIIEAEFSTMDESE
ncbi:MAG: SRPBCC family protein [Saprospiraceae bacterium]|nr:SRPBCC family protein [Bacteroidia bacterium]NNK90758.1 SRPBCC family protein [Saprospiraceae bacterium]